MAANDSVATGVSDKKSPAGGLGNEVQKSRTNEAVRYATVYGTLFIVGLLTVYLVFGAMGFLSADKGVDWETARALARILVFPVLGCFFFVFMRPWIEEGLATWLGAWRKQVWYQLGALVLVSVLGIVLGFRIASTVQRVSYDRPAEVQMFIDQAISNAVEAVRTDFLPTTTADSAASATPQKSGDSDSQDNESGTGDDVSKPSGSTQARPTSDPARGTDLYAAIRLAVGSATATAIRSAMEDSQGVTLAVDATVEAAIGAGIEPSQSGELRNAVREAIRVPVAAAVAFARGTASEQRKPRRDAEYWLGLSLMFLIFGPRELLTLLKERPSGAQPLFGSAQAGLSLYWGVLFGLILFLISYPGT